MRIHFWGEPDDGISVSSHHARALAQSGANVCFSDPAQATKSVAAQDIVHFECCGRENLRLLKDLTAARMIGARVIRYWSGRDLQWAKHYLPSRDFAAACVRLGAMQLARCEELATELRELLDVEVCVPPVLSMHLSSDSTPTPLPSRFTVLAHLPSALREYCGGPVIDKLIQRFPSVRFIVLGDVQTDYSRFANVESLGVITDVSRAIRRSSVLVQPRVDGQLTRLSLEMLGEGRYVIGTHAGPQMRCVHDLDEFADSIRALQPRPPFHLSARESVCRMHDRREATAALLAILQQTLTSKSWGSVVKGAVQGVASILSLPQSLSEDDGAFPDPARLPPEAEAFKVLLRDQVRTRSPASPSTSTCAV